MTACSTKPAVVNLDGTIKNITARQPSGHDLHVVNAQSREFWVVINDQTSVVGGPVKIGQTICVEFGYLTTNRPGGRSRVVIEARILVVQ